MPRISSLAMVMILIGGCSNKFESIPDDELADKSYDCTSTQEQSPGMAIMCDNVARECSRRREEGKFVC